MLIEFSCQWNGTHPVAGDVWYRFAMAYGEDNERYQRYMCDALTMLVYHTADAAEMLRRIDLVAAGKVDEAHYGLNDTRVTFREDGVQVDILIEDETGVPAGRFSLQEYRKVVVAWHDFLSIPAAQAKPHRVRV